MPGSSDLWIKICGVRDVQAAVRIAKLGADAVGVNFYAESPRCVADVDTAREIVGALPDSTIAVGVFVNHTAQEIRRICTETGITTVQLHGDEQDTLIGQLSVFRVIRALRASGGFAAEAAAHLSSYAAVGTRPAAWLIDARVPGAYGGTGRTVEWESLASLHRGSDWPDLILAGGLTPDNVGDAVRIVRPWGVDVASGVESAPGEKDLSLVERFVATCRRCTPAHRPRSEFPPC